MKSLTTQISSRPNSKSVLFKIGRQNRIPIKSQCQNWIKINKFLIKLDQFLIEFDQFQLKDQKR